MSAFSYKKVLCQEEVCPREEVNPAQFYDSVTECMNAACVSDHTWLGPGTEVPDHWHELENIVSSKLSEVTCLMGNDCMSDDQPYTSDLFDVLQPYVRNALYPALIDYSYANFDECDASSETDD
jgi:hypothetical protein